MCFTPFRLAASISVLLCTSMSTVYPVIRKSPVTFVNASSKVRGSSRSMKREAPNWSASSSRFAFLRVPTENRASLLFKFFATSFPTSPVTPNTSRLLEVFILNLLCTGFLLGNSGLALAAGGQNDLPRQPTGLVGGQEHCDRRDVRGLPDAAEGRHGNHLLLVITSDSDNAGRASALRCRCPGVDRVHSNLSRPQLLCEHSCDCVESTLGCRVDRQAGRGHLRRHRADVDDAATPRPEVLDGLTDHQKGTEYVRVELPVEFFLGHRF